MNTDLDSKPGLWLRILHFAPTRMALLYLALTYLYLSGFFCRTSFGAAFDRAPSGMASRRRRPSRTRVSSSASRTRAGKDRRSRYFFRPARTKTSPTAATAPAASGGIVTVSLSVLWM